MKIYVGILTISGILFSIPSTHTHNQQASNKTSNTITKPSTIPNLCNDPELISLLNLYPAGSFVSLFHYCAPHMVSIFSITLSRVLRRWIEKVGFQARE
jgi:hypothetical protein